MVKFYADFQERLNAYYAQNRVERIYIPIKGMLCIVFNGQDWLRGFIESVDETENCSVFLMDRAKEALVHWTNLFRLVKKYNCSSAVAGAIKFKLDGILTTDENFSNHAVYWLEKKCQKTNLRVEILTDGDSEIGYGVNLFLFKPGSNEFHVNPFLIAKSGENVSTSTCNQLAKECTVQNPTKRRTDEIDSTQSQVATDHENNGVSKQKKSAKSRKSKSKSKPSRSPRDAQGESVSTHNQLVKHEDEGEGNSIRAGQKDLTQSQTVKDHEDVDVSKHSEAKIDSTQNQCEKDRICEKDAAQSETVKPQKSCDDETASAQIAKDDKVEKDLPQNELREDKIDSAQNQISKIHENTKSAEKQLTVANITLKTDERKRLKILFEHRSLSVSNMPMEILVINNVFSIAELVAAVEKILGTDQVNKILEVVKKRSSNLFNANCSLKNDLFKNMLCLDQIEHKN